MTSTSARIAARKPQARSRITNGASILRGVDGRSADARRFRDLLQAFTADLGGNGNLSEAERTLVRQAAATTVAAERLQTALMNGQDVDLGQLGRLTNTTAKLLQRLGHKRTKAASAALTSMRDKLMGNRKGSVA